MDLMRPFSEVFVERTGGKMTSTRPLADEADEAESIVAICSRSVS